MSDEESGDGGDAPHETPPSPTDHNEALIAALLGAERLVQQPRATVDEGDVSSQQGPSPLTASSVIRHTLDGAADAPASSAAAEEGATGAGPPGADQPGGDALEDGERGGADQSSEEPEDSLAKSALEWFVVLGAAVVVAVILRTFVFQAFYIPSESMETTLFQGDRILVNKVSYRLHDINRGDVVVFRRPDDQPGDIRDLIKRVIGLPGDTVEGRNSQILVNGQLLVEPYLGDDQFADFGPVMVAEGEYFMMGDNRDQSLDSRRFGTIPEERVIGRAFVLFWPVDRFGLL